MPADARPRGLKTVDHHTVNGDIWLVSPRPAKGEKQATTEEARVHAERKLRDAENAVEIRIEAADLARRTREAAQSAEQQAKQNLDTARKELDSARVFFARLHGFVLPTEGATDE